MVETEPLNKTEAPETEADNQELPEEVETVEEKTTKVVDSEGKEKLSLNKGEIAFIGKENGLDTKFGIFKKDTPVKISKEASKYLKETFGKLFIFG